MTVTNSSATRSGEPETPNGVVNKSRKTIHMVFRLFLLGVLACAAWFIGKKVDRPATPRRLVTAAPVVPIVPVKANKETIGYIVKKGDTFSGILSQFGVSGALSNNIYRVLKPLGLQALFPGDSIVLTFMQDSLLAGFSVESRLQNWYHCTIRGDSVAARKTPVATAVYRCLVRGVLSTSLSEDLVKMGVGDACVAMFADIFAWDINFFVDPQKGDSFEIVVEKKYAEGRFTGYGNILAALYVNNGKTYAALGLPGPDGIVHYFDRGGNPCRSSSSRRRSGTATFPRGSRSAGSTRCWGL
jgi:hypothetical protein